MTQLYLSPIGLLIQQLTNLGQPLAGGLVNIYVAGSVSTPQVTYTDSTGTTQNANPLVLNSAGRLAASNAPVSVWLPANTPHKMVLTDATGNLLAGGACLDNLFGINDPTAFLSALANPATGSGADLVANAMRSYDVLASLRAANVPALGAGQTLVVDVEGANLINDSNGGLFYWVASATGADDGVTIIKPNAILTANPGRYLRQTNLYGTTGVFTASFLGFTTTPTMTVRWVKNGNLVTVSYDGVTGTSNSASFSISGWPIGLRGISVSGQSPLVYGVDAGAFIPAAIQVQNQIGGNAVVSIGNASGNWTGSGTKGLLAGSFSYVTG